MSYKYICIFFLTLFSEKFFTNELRYVKCLVFSLVERWSVIHSETTSLRVKELTLRFSVKKVLTEGSEIVCDTTSFVLEMKPYKSLETGRLQFPSQKIH